MFNPIEQTPSIAGWGLTRSSERLVFGYSKETQELARRAAQGQEEQRRREVTMTPEEYQKYIENWAMRLAQDLAAYGD